MTVYFLILIMISLVLGLGGVTIFVWCLRTNQFEDLDGAAERILYHDDLDEEEGHLHLSRD